MVLFDKCEVINLIVMGDIGLGKFFFVNMLKIVFRDNDYIVNVVFFYGINFLLIIRRVSY